MHQPGLPQYLFVCLLFTVVCILYVGAPQRDLTVYVNKQGLVADLLQEAAKELQVMVLQAAFAFTCSLLYGMFSGGPACSFNSAWPAISPCLYFTADVIEEKWCPLGVF